jgi:predicted HicB family RNase H-like nuclease
MKEGAEFVSVIPRSELSNGPAVDRRARQVLRFAEALYEKKPDWVTFFREVLGVDGVVQKLYPSVEEMAEFERSEANARVQFLITRLRERPSDESQQRVPQRMITVRLPAPLHDALRTEADLREVSMNSLCISKLLQMINEEHVPATTSTAQAESADAPKSETIVPKPK